MKKIIMEEHCKENLKKKKNSKSHLLLFTGAADFGKDLNSFFFPAGVSWTLAFARAYTTPHQLSQHQCKAAD